MTPALTPADLTLLRDAIVALRQQRQAVATFASRFLQGPAQTGALVATGHQLRELDALDYRLREQLGRLTGTPHIQHGNTDLHDPATEAHEANLRG